MSTYATKLFFFIEQRSAHCVLSSGRERKEQAEGPLKSRALLFFLTISLTV